MKEHMYKLLVAGPWLGEFGWLLMRWQGHIRYLSMNYDKTIILHADNLIDRGYLFDDFAENLKAGFEYRGKVDRWNAEINPQQIVLPGDTDLIGIDHIDYINPSEEICKRKNLQQEFINYGERLSLHKEKRILFHARDVKQKQYGVDRNWPIEKWEELALMIKNEFTYYGIECIGSYESSLTVNGTLDYRGVGLRNLIKNISSAKVLIGPSSGPHHLASLCGTHSIVWTGTERWDLGCKAGTNMERYKTGWNPFGTSCDIIETWQPSVEEVFNMLAKYLEKDEK